MIKYFNHTKSKIKKHTDSQMPGRWLILPDIFAGHHERMLQKQREDMRRKYTGNFLSAFYRTEDEYASDYLPIPIAISSKQPTAHTINQYMTANNNMRQLQ